MVPGALQVVLVLEAVEGAARPLSPHLVVAALGDPEGALVVADLNPFAEGYDELQA